MTPEQRARLREAAGKATPGEWYHVNPGVTLPAARTVHGRVPAQRVDYVSTWPGLGTPVGHRVVVDMEGCERAPSSEDMAYIAAANPARVLELIEQVRGAEAQSQAAEARVRELEGALKDAVSVLQMMVSPDAIRSTTVLNAYAAAVAAEARCRAALKDPTQ